MAEGRSTFWRGNRWLMWVAGGLLSGLLVVIGIVAVVAHRAEPFLRARIVKVLQDRFHARVELNSFHISLDHGSQGRWGVWAEGKGLRIWPSAQAEAGREQAGSAQGEGSGSDEPLMQVEEFRFHAPLAYNPGKPLRISQVRVEGLQIHVPPNRHDIHSAGAPGISGTLGASGIQGGRGAKPAAGHPSEEAQAGTAESPDAGDRPASANPFPNQPTNPTANPPENRPKDAGIFSNVMVERIDCDRAELVLETNKPGKLPLGFAIEHLTLTGVTADGPIGFEADLTNPQPLGKIHTTGSFGPWQAEDPGASAVSGDYHFDHADLSGFKGIAGLLNSTGHYAGTLRAIVVDGETDTPDFRLTDFGNPMRLHTRFHASVDGTDGDTWLEPVDATLGNSHFTAQGSVVRFKSPVDAATADNVAQQAEPGSPLVKESPFRGGHEIALTVNVDRARIEDFLELATHSKTPLLTGPVTLKAELRIPPGPAKVHERMQLKGSFTLNEVRFTSAKIQDRIEELSLRGRGRPEDIKTTNPESIDSAMQGDFQMVDGTITLPALKYTVPGAVIQLKGTYDLKGETLNFEGSAKMEATVSQMVGGWKGLLLKPADRFFKKNGVGTDVPIRISGTRADPQFGLDFGRNKNSEEK